MDHTVQIARPALVASFLRTIATPFEAFGSFLVRLGDRLPVMIALDRLAETSDEAFRARGLTRDDEMRRILGPRYLL